MNCGKPIVERTPTDDQRQSRLAAAAPQSLAEKAKAANRLSGERRIVTALYIDVVRSRALIQQMGQLAAEEIIYAGLDVACPVIYKYEGTIAQLQDDEMLVFFGAPVAHEDDPVRAVHAGLEILEATRQYAQTVKQEQGIDFAVRISLSTGPVKIGPVGEDLRFEYSALGGELNLAAQLEAVKLANCVLISESTYRFVAPFFELHELEETSPGLAQEEAGQKFRFYRVAGPKATPSQARGLAGLHSPMVGRDKELQTLLQLSQAVQAGIGRGVLIQGDPGIGKSRLVQEWKAAVVVSHPTAALQWFEGHCHSYEQSTPYHLVSSLLHSIIGVPDAADEPQVRLAFRSRLESLLPQEEAQTQIYPYLGQILNLQLEDKELERLRYLDPQDFLSLSQNAMRRLLTRLAACQPVILILEDLHWADPSSVNFLTPLLGLAATEPILFALVMRLERESEGRRLVVAAREALGGRLSSLTLEPLRLDESRKLVSNLLEVEALPATVRDLILEKAEGNPFFVEEVIRMLIDRQAITNVNGRWQSSVDIEGIRIPDNLHGLLLARIDRLPEDVKQTLRIAAVIGRQFSTRVLEHVLKRLNQSQEDKIT